MNLSHHLSPFFVVLASFCALAQPPGAFLGELSWLEAEARLKAAPLVISWDDLETPALDSLQEQKAGGHADEIETSINLFLQPDLVHLEKAVVDYGTSGRKNYPGYEPGLFSRNPHDSEFSASGLFGDPTKATAEKGKKGAGDHGAAMAAGAARVCGSAVTSG